MKVLIWIGCLFANALITTLITQSGIMLGAIPTMILFGGTLWLAQTLCKKWDERKEEKEAIKKAYNHYSKPIVETKDMDNINRNTAFVGQWQCSCGRVHPKYESSCVCGKSKTEITKLQKSEKTEIYSDVSSETHDQILFCRKCGNKLIKGAFFCGKCGMKVIRE